MQKHYIRTQQASKHTINRKTELFTARRRRLELQLVSIRPYDNECKSLRHHMSDREPATRNFVTSQNSS